MIRHRTTVFEMNDLQSGSRITFDNLLDNTENEANYQQLDNFDSRTVNAMAYRTTSIHRNKKKIFLDAAHNLNLKTKVTSSQVSPEETADSIVDAIKVDATLMANSVEAEQMRRKMLRDMPRKLALKKLVKMKMSVFLKINRRADDSTFYSKVERHYRAKRIHVKAFLNSLSYTFQLWYKSLKTIEGHFGSGVATYFSFFRHLFITNCLVALSTILFITLPQFFYANHKRESVTSLSSVRVNATENLNPLVSSWETNNNNNNNESHLHFDFVDAITGEGYLTQSLMYYGYYVNDTIDITKKQSYNLPYAYFFTNIVVYILSFIALSSSMARSYKKTFIETRCGLKNNYAKKLFSSWDFSITTQDAAKLKSSFIYRELKELIGDSTVKRKDSTCVRKLWTCIVRLLINVQVVAVLASVGYLIWYLLERHQSDEDRSATLSIVTAILIDLIMLALPPTFSFIVRYEDYRHPRAAFYVTLLRTFVLKMIIIGVLLTFWITRSMKQPCWENGIGQQIYRLILFNFLFSVIFSAIVEGLRFVLFKYLWKGIGLSEYNTAHYASQLMYTQSLFWIGLFFSPPLALLVVFMSWITWYIRKFCLLNFNEPPSISWRAAYVQTYFLILSFLSFLLVLIAYGYIIVSVPTSTCGPFRNYDFMYQVILIDILKLEQNNMFWKISGYLTKPGTVSLIFVAMCVIVYYQRARAQARSDMVQFLKEMLILEAKDKEFLLKSISKITEELRRNMREAD